jgi:transposase-like protein
LIYGKELSLRMRRKKDSCGTLHERNGKTAARFLGKVKAQHPQTLRVSRDASGDALTVDKNAAYPVAIDKLKSDKTTLAVSAEPRAEETELRQIKYLNNIIE